MPIDAVATAITKIPQETTNLPINNLVLNDTDEQPTVLLIEDNTELRSFIKTCIDHTWQVIEASNGEEGVQKALDILPDLVISDVMMPIKDGYMVCDDLKNNELTSHIPIILLTAKSSMDAKLKGLRTGADDYLTKPFNSEELRARMDNLVTIRRQLRQRYYQSSMTNNTSEVEDDLTPPDREFLRRLILVLDQHLQDETLGIEELAQKMFISRVQLHRKLKAITDQNATDFVRDYRLNRAMSMLRNREGMVFEVASQVGFTSEKYFSRVFKDKFGIPPSQVM
jgi:DNA-binding response OmpR family regulator